MNDTTEQEVSYSPMHGWLGHCSRCGYEFGDHKYPLHMEQDARADMAWHHCQVSEQTETARAMALIAAHNAHIQHRTTQFGFYEGTLVVGGKAYETTSAEMTGIEGIMSGQLLYASKCERMVRRWLKLQGIDVRKLAEEMKAKE